MADPSKLAQFKYAAMSNLVLQADRRFVTRRTDENTGDPESLAGRVQIRDMGAALSKNDSAPSKKFAVANVERGNIREGEDVLEREQRKKNRDAQSQSTFALADVEIEDLRYRPRSDATRNTYNHIVTTVGKHLGDVSGQIIVSATDVVIETLKNEEMKDFDKKKEVDDVLGISMGPKEFNELVNLGKRITDFDNQDQDENQKRESNGAPAANEAALDEDEGVAIDFNIGAEEDEDGIVRTAEVRDEDETSDEDPEEFAGRHGAEEAAAAGGAGDEGSEDEVAGEDEEMVIDSRLDEEEHQVDFIPAHEIDAFWLQRQVGSVYQDAHAQQEKTQEALDLLSGIPKEGGEKRDARSIQNDLMNLFRFERNDLSNRLVGNKDRVLWITRWRRTAEDDNARKKVEAAMVEEGHAAILEELQSRDQAALDIEISAKKETKTELMDLDVPAAPKDVDMADVGAKGGIQGGLEPKQLVDLNNIMFDQGNHLMTNPNVKLPPGSVKRSYKGYEEIDVPAPKPRRGPDEAKNMPTSSLPHWAQVGFGSSKELNRIQTQCFPCAFEDDSNMLVCAPTGSGKTNVAMLAMLREIGKYRDPETGQINLNEFKIVYIAPLKALVQEQVGNFGNRLAPYGIKVSELTGDRQLTKQQIAETQIIVTTPEKWDVITRKATDLSYTNLVRLICIDEIHLLHDDRGPVLESIVSRQIRKMEQTGEPVRIVGLSATLPNYRDVADFLRVDRMKGMFHFDGTFRPCPLKQQFIGVTDKKPIKQLRTMNDVCYQKVLEQVGKKSNQMLIFVHSRKETAKTAKYIRDKALENETIAQIVRSDASVREIVRVESEILNNTDAKDLVPYSIGIHHAGMTRADRTSIEELFSAGYIQVLVCTATLAWGVNLPAHTVIIKGTTVYSPEKGTWVELSPQDVLQMLGRAGRPQYDTFGEGIILTTQSELQYYLSLINQQLPIESQFASKLVDSLNAEIVLGNIRSRDDGVEWLGYTYFFVRMLRAPGLYSVGADYEDDEALEQKRVDLIHSAAMVLESTGLIRYERRNGRLQTTELGRIASHYYITHNSMMKYNKNIQPAIGQIEMFRAFANSEEFKYIPVRQDEKLELAKLLTRVPIPVKETVEDPAAKINVLLQAFISRLKLDGLALMADLVYVTQSAGRILRAMFEICLRKGLASVAKTALDLCKMAERRMWPTMTPLRQFPERSEGGRVPHCAREVVAKAERVEVPWQSYLDLDPPRLGELLGMPKAGRIVHNAIQHFPRLDVQAQAVPITRSLLKVELTIIPMFEWNEQLHGAAELFWILIEDCDGEDILFHDQFVLRKTYAQAGRNEHIVELTVPMTEPIPPNYFITVLSDRWMHSEMKVSLSLQKLILPERFPPHTPILDLQPLPVTALKRDEYQALYQHVSKFNKILTQVFQSLFTTNDNVFVGAPVGSGKTVCAEFAILRQWNNPEAGRSIYVAPFQELVDARFEQWRTRLARLCGGKEIVKLTGETSADLRLLEKGDLILATPSQWDLMSRQWQRRKSVQSVTLFIADELHMLGGQNGHVYEAVMSRTHSFALQLESGMRLIGLSAPLSNARDIGDWIGARKNNIYNFSPLTRPTPLELHIQSFTIPHFPSLMLAMARPTYQSIMQLSSDKPAMIFVPGRKQVRKTALDILGSCVADDNESTLLHADVKDLSKVLERIDERALAESLTHGIAYFHEALSPFDKQAVKYLFQQGAVQVMLVSRDCCWEIDVKAHLVVVMGTQFFDGREHRYIDYPIAEVLQMFGRAGRPQDKKSKGVLMVPAVKRDYYKKFLNEALPIESHLHDNLHDVFLPEISNKMITSTQDAVDWVTFTYLYRRFLANPSYYSLTDTSNEGLSAHLSELVETTLTELSDASIVELDEEQGSITPLNSARIASFYNICFVTMQTFLLSLHGKIRMKALLEIVTSATEFESIPIRRHEDVVLRRIHERIPAKLAEPSYETPGFKAFVLLQAHFSRMQLPVDLLEDQRVILRKVPSLLSACVDVLSSEGHLNTILAMEMSQMVVQGMWDSDSPLKQVPHFTPEAIEVAKEAGINDISEFMEAMDPEENKGYDRLVKRLGFDARMLTDAANFTNSKYPNVDMSFDVLDKDEIVAGSPAQLSVTIEREVDDDDEDTELDTRVHCPFFPANKMENWWLVVGEEASRLMLGIRKFTLGRRYSTKLDYTVPSAGRKQLTLYLMCDSYVGVDQAPAFEVDVAEDEDEDEDESEHEEDEDAEKENENEKNENEMEEDGE